MTNAWPDQAVLLRAMAEQPQLAGLPLERLIALCQDAELVDLPEAPVAGSPPLPGSALIVTGRLDRIDEVGVSDIFGPGDVIDLSELIEWRAEGVSYWPVPSDLATGYEVVESVGDDLIGLAEVRLAPLLTLDGELAVDAAAAQMSVAGVTGALVRAPGGLGIVTDADLRVRFVAQGSAPTTRVGEIATYPARIIGAGASLAEAKEVMLKHGIHHLPVMDLWESYGLLTDANILETSHRDTSLLRTEIERALDLAAIRVLGERMRSTMRALLVAGTDVDRLSRLTSVLTDSLARRLLWLAQAELGEPMTDYSWVALGSWGRREQGLVFDQDHAVVFRDPGQAELVLAIARYVESGLEAAGIRRCPSNVMASQVGWHGTIDEWRDRLLSWLSIPERRAVFLVSTALDGRRVRGAIDLEPLHAEVVAHAARSGTYLNGLTELILDARVPLGFLGDLVLTDEGDASSIDVKHRGLVPVTLMARRFGIEAGIGAAGTADRLKAAIAAGVLDEVTGVGLIEAQRLFREVIVDHHREQMESGAPSTDEVPFAPIGPIRRRTLREAFRLVRRVQREMRSRMLPHRWR